ARILCLEIGFQPNPKLPPSGGSSLLSRNSFAFLEGFASNIPHSTALFNTLSVSFLLGPTFCLTRLP
ncbi:MAG: hypothetical protein ACE5K2_06020, partial [Candidatus Zixiibacteriota bacterium]